MAGLQINTVSGEDLDAARVGFHAAFLGSLESVGPDPLEDLYAKIDSTSNAEEWEWLGDLPGFEEWKGDRKLAGLDQFKLRIENKNWASGLRVHQNQLADNRTGMLRLRIDGLAAKARKHRTDYAVKLLLNGFTGLAYPETGNGLGYDGAFFFSTTHQQQGYSTVQSNKLTLALDADGVALETATQMLGAMKSYDGSEILDMSGTTLIVGPKLQFVAERLMGAEYLANGASNIHRNRYRVLVSPRLTGAYDDYWFLADMSAPIKPLIFQMREEISTSAIVGNKGGSNDSLPRFQYGELWFGAEARYGAGYFEWRTIIGSQVA
jgi:phage major head subunit gpT-like protein